ncbi:MAG: glycosyltransferase 87 family protein [Chloroflexota bacterium]|nr:glycosyltransferase 87 family protein [Chloroflexota bacterium]
MKQGPVAAAIAAALVTLIGAIPRVLLAAGALPDALRPFVWSDTLLVYERGLSGHRLPYVDTPFEYPPLIGLISGALSLLAPGPAPFVAAWALIVAVTGACCAALLVASGHGRAWRSFVVAPQLLLLGTINFDLLPVLLLTLAVLAQRGGRVLTAMVALGLGTGAKLYPAASAPLSLARGPRRALSAAAFVAVLALLYLPTALQPYSSAAGVGFYAVGIRSNIDSVWGLAERLLTGLGLPNAPLLVLAATIGGLGLTYVGRVLPRAGRASDPAIGFCLATIAVLFWSRLYSPQYSLWLLPFFPLLGLGGRALALLTLADIGVFFTIYPLTLVRYGPDDLVPTVLLAALAAFVVLRHLALWRMWREVLARADATPVAREIRRDGQPKREDGRHRS